MRDHLRIVDTRPRIGGRPVSPAITEAIALRELGICLACGGAGEWRHEVLSPSPFSGVPVADPEREESSTCRRCLGTGTDPDATYGSAA